MNIGLNAGGTAFTALLVFEIFGILSYLYIIEPSQNISLIKKTQVKVTLLILLIIEGIFSIFLFFPKMSLDSLFVFEYSGTINTVNPTYSTVNEPTTFTVTFENDNNEYVVLSGGSKSLYVGNEITLHCTKKDSLVCEIIN